jgi:hypothetical protein
MGSVVLELPEAVHADLLAHLVRPKSRSEETAFVFAKAAIEGDCTRFEFLDWTRVPLDGFVHRSLLSLELTDEMRGRIIKRAHDLGSSLVEFHSHPASRWAEFSPSDRVGLREFVPHVWWRLKGRPYVAVVVAPLSFDGLVWLSNGHTPQLLDEIHVGRKVLRPTGRSLKRWEDLDAT